MLSDAKGDTREDPFQAKVLSGIWRKGKFCEMNEASHKLLELAIDKFGLASGLINAS